MARICTGLLSERLVVATGEIVAIFGEAKPFLLSIQDVGLQKSESQTPDNAVSAAEKIMHNNQGADCHVLCLRGCKCGLHVAVSNNRKQLVVIELPREDKDNHVCSRIIFSTQLQRNSLCVAFMNNCDRIIVADKSGDVFSYDIKSGKHSLLFGHLAMILDIVISAYDKLVITCDRDEKIKTTNYPNTYNIQSFCLGHTEYVIGIGIVPGSRDILYSASGDGTIRLWRHNCGTCLNVFHCKDHLPDEIVVQCRNVQHEFRRCPEKSVELDDGQSTTTSEKCIEPSLLVPIKKVAISQQNVIAAIFHGLPIISLVKVIHEKEVNGKSACRHLQNLSVPFEPWDVCFDLHGNLLTLGVCDGDSPVVTGYTFKDDRFAPFEANSKAACLLGTVKDNWHMLKVSSDVPSIIPTLFKQWYDNVSEYYETKLKRTDTKLAGVSGASNKIRRLTE